jgi:hypothetical protein
MTNNICGLCKTPVATAQAVWQHVFAPVIVSCFARSTVAATTYSVVLATGANLIVFDYMHMLPSTTTIMSANVVTIFTQVTTGYNRDAACRCLSLTL